MQEEVAIWLVTAWPSADLAPQTGEYGNTRQRLQLRTFQFLRPKAYPSYCSDALSFVLIPLNFLRKKIWQSCRQLLSGPVWSLILQLPLTHLSKGENP